MNEQDRESWELIFRGLAMAGYLINGDYTAEEIPALATRLGKATLDYEEPDDGGIASIKRKYVRRKTNDA